MAVEDQAMLAAQYQALSRLCGATMSSAKITATLRSIVGAMESSVIGLSDLVHEMADPCFFNERSSAGASHAVHAVLEVPELVENILSHLTVSNLLSAQQVNKTIFEVVRTSLRLQRQVGLLADTNAFFCMPLAMFQRSGRYDCEPPGFSLMSLAASKRRNPSSRSRSTHFIKQPDNSIKISATFMLDAAGRLPKIGDRCMSMYICQPPITEMEAFTSCCQYPFSRIGSPDHARGSRPSRLIAAPGLQVRHLYEAAAELL